MEEIPLDIAPQPAHRPKTRAPQGATDCHFHIFGPKSRFPLSPDRMYEPVEASVLSYRRMAEVLGIQRAVVVNASPYGFDNSCLLDSLQNLAIPARGVAVVRPEVSEADLDYLQSAGARGIRVNAIAGASPASHIVPLAKRIKRFGMHLQLWIPSAHLGDLLGHLSEIDIPVVIDHMGQIQASEADGSPQFQNLISLLKTGQVWIKLIGYRVSSGPPYEDLKYMVKRIVDTAPHRCIWGTDWPHPFLQGKPMPNDGDLFDLLGTWFDEIQLQRVLVDNPTELYGFKSVD